MADELADALGADFDADTGTPEGSTPEPQAATDTTETPAPADPASPEAPDEAGLKAFKAQYLAQYPDQAELVEQIHREMQAGLTPKLQEAAEIRRRFEGLDDQTAQWARHAQDLFATNPAAAADWLTQQAETLRQQHQQSDPYANLEFATDTERVLTEKLKQVEQFMYQQQVAQARTEMDRQFSDLEKQFGMIPLEQRQAAANLCSQNNWRPEQIGLAWKGLYGIEAALKKGRSERQAGDAVRQGAAPPPSAVTPRVGKPAVDLGSMSLRDAIAADLGE